MSFTVILIIILGSGVSLLSFFIIKSFLSPRRIEVVAKYINQGKTSQAIRILKTIAAKEPRNVDAHYFLGLAYIKDGKSELGLMELKKVNEIGIFTRYCKEIPFRTKMAELFRKFNQPEEALKEYLLLIKSQPYDASHYFRVGELFEERGKNDNAIGYFLKALELDKDYGPAHYKLGVIYLRQKNNAEAKKELQSAIKNDKDNVAAHFYLGRVLKESKDYGGALQAFEKATRDTAFKTKSLIERGVCYLSMNNIEMAIPELERAVNTAKDNSSAEMLYGMYYLSYCYEKTRNIDKAISLWEKIYAQQSNFKDVAEKLGQYQELRADDKLKDYMTSHDEEFEQICKSIARALKLDTREISHLVNGCQIIAFEAESKWRNVRKIPLLLRCLRVTEVIDESTVRSLHEEMKKTNINRGVLITNSTFSKRAYEFAETRPIDLFNKEKLTSVLSTALS